MENKFEFEVEKLLGRPLKQSEKYALEHELAYVIVTDGKVFINYGEPPMPVMNNDGTGVQLDDDYAELANIIKAEYEVTKNPIVPLSHYVDTKSLAFYYMCMQILFEDDIKAKNKRNIHTD